MMAAACLLLAAAAGASSTTAGTPCGEVLRRHLVSLRQLHGDGLLDDSVYQGAQAAATARCANSLFDEATPAATVELVAAEIAAAGSDPTTIVVAGDRPVLTDMFVPANVLLKFEMGGRLLLGDGVNVTIAGPMEAPPTQLFAINDHATSHVLFTSGLAGPVLPQWFGAAAGDDTDDTAAIQAALDAAAPASVGDYQLRARVWLSHGLYRVNSTLWLDDGAQLFGDDATLKGAVGPHAAMLAPRKANRTRTDVWKLKGLRLDGLDPSKSGAGLWFSMTNYAIVEQVNIVHFDTGLLMNGVWDVCPCMDNVFKDMQVRFDRAPAGGLVCGVSRAFRLVTS